ncbi:hypothetical protein HYV74_00430 [Candidatus Uhrbacteria bacterium]|nr:hypothetical protein [Candidatus Uhrbacteria bacterium]
MDTSLHTSEVTTTERPPMGDRLGMLIPILVLTVLGVGYGLLLRPQFVTLRDLRARHALRAEADALERGVREVRQLSEVGGSLADARAVVDAAIPGIDDVPGLMTVMESAAQRSRVVVGGVEVSREPAPATMPELAGNDTVMVGISLRRVEYESLKTFVYLLEKSHRVLDVLSVQFSPKALTATIRARAYLVR